MLFQLVPPSVLTQNPAGTSGPQLVVGAVPYSLLGSFVGTNTRCASGFMLSIVVQVLPPSVLLRKPPTSTAT